MPGSRVEIFQVITQAGWPGEWPKREAGQRVTHCSCALLPRLVWSGPYCELYCYAVCTWKLRNLPLSWFVYERIRLNLINPRVLKIERGLHVKMLDSAPFTVRSSKNDLFYEIILLDKILGNHLLPHPRGPRGSQSGRVKRRDESFQAWAEEPLGTDSHRTISKRSRELFFHRADNYFSLYREFIFGPTMLCGPCS